MSGPDLAELLERHFSGELDAAGAARLLEACRRDPGAARALAELTRVERALAWHHAGRGGEAFAGEVLMRLGPERKKASGFVRAVLSRVQPRRGWRPGWFPVAAAAILLAALGAVGLWRVMNAPLPVEASVAGTRGQVRAVSRGLSLEARPGLDLRAGDSLQTGTDGRADAATADGAALRLEGDTDVRFQPRRVELRQGALQCRAAPRASGDPFVVATPHAEAAVLGTDFELAATRTETRLRTIEGLVRFTSAGRSVDVREGGLSTADARGLRSWEPVCDLDFTGSRSVPAALEPLFCSTKTLHTPDRRIVAAPERLVPGPGGLGFVNVPGDENTHGLVVARLREEVGEDAVVEAAIAGGSPWTLGISVSGDSFEGYRAVFVSSHDRSGIAVDSIHPVEVAVLARSPQTIAFDRDRVLRVEKLGNRIRVWVDRDLRIDTEVSYPLPEKRLKTVALSNFGGPPVVRHLRVWRRSP